MNIKAPYTLQEISALQDEILVDRLEITLPSVMKECGVEMWIVLGDEYNEGPVVRSLLPSSFFHARKTSLFVFAQVDEKNYRYIVSKPDFSIDKFYTPALLKPIGFNWEKFYTTFAQGYDIEAIRAMKEEDMWGALSRLIKEINPKNIALDISSNSAFSDGLSKTNYEYILNSIDTEYRDRIISGEEVAIRFLETRTPKEIELMRKVVDVTRQIIIQTYSLHVITPGKTTTGEVRFHLMQEAIKLGMSPWFDATVWIRRKGSSHIDDDNEIIQKGDILHCDFGVVYGRICSDVQEMAYVKDDNDGVLISELENIQKISNSFQDIVMHNLVVGKSGNEVLSSSLKEAKES
ncbi:MAG: M24 family metallopeptidase, partial [Spirochaetia bacterium]|nr:M24 family metallopeptidase [Spirochaetia bacterium]